MADIASISFDVSISEIHVPLPSVGTVVCVDAETILDHDVLRETFHQHKVQSAIFTPSLLKQHLISSPGTVSPLKTVFVAGTRASAKDLQTVQKITGGTVINAYGPTENSVINTIFNIPEEESCTNGVPIGQAISTSGAYVMDSQQHLVPIGIFGELVVTGDGLAKGYMDLLQNEGRFVNIQVGTEQVAAYRTGDFLRRCPIDGQFSSLDKSMAKSKSEAIVSSWVRLSISFERTVTCRALLLSHSSHRLMSLVFLHYS